MMRQYNYYTRLVDNWMHETVDRTTTKDAIRGYTKRMVEHGIEVNVETVTALILGMLWATAVGAMRKESWSEEGLRQARNIIETEILTIRRRVSENILENRANQGR